MYQGQNPIAIKRIISKSNLINFIAALSATLVLTLACTLLDFKEDVAASKGAMEDEAASLEPGDVPEKALAPLRDVWEILETDFVLRRELAPRALEAGAVDGLLQASNVPSLRSNHTFKETSLARPNEVPKELDLIWHTWAGLFQGHNTTENPLDPIFLSQAAIRGLIDALNDPHTSYITPERYGLKELDFTGAYQGIGAEVHNQRGRFILSPMPNSPAEAAGIRPGDLLIAVNGVSVEGWSTIEVVQTIRGKKGTEVLLGIIHLGQDKVEHVSINRGEIDLTSVF